MSQELAILIMPELLSYARKLQIWSHLLKKSLMENSIFCAVWLKAVSYFCQNVQPMATWIIDYMDGKVR